MTRLPGLTYPSNEYLLALGEAVFNFGLVEQGVVHFIDHKEPGFSASSFDMTALPIMQHLERMVQGNEQLEKLAEQAISLAVLRNTILHGRPAGEHGSEPSLKYAGREGFHEWTLEDINRFSELCVEVMSFFGEWASEVVEHGGTFTNLDAFTQRFDEVRARWKQRAEKRRR